MHMSKDFRRRLCALISAYILLIGCYLSSCNKKEVTYNPHYKYQSEDEYAYYNGGKIYICNEDTIDRIRDDETRDIYVIDQGKKVQLVSKTEGTIIVNMEQQIQNEILNYCAKAYDIIKG